MEEIAKLLKNIQDEMTLQKEEMKEMQRNITQNINDNVNEKFKEIDKKYSNLAEEIENQDKKIENIERHIRKKNIIIFGVIDDETNYFQLSAKITNIINEKMKIPCDKSEIEYIRRIGKKGDKPRPVAVTLLTMYKKIEILKNKKSLDGSPYYIKEDFTQKVLEKRRALQPQVQKLRDEGKQVIIKYDKIVMIENVNSNLKSAKKRVLSISPDINNKSAQKTKKNKSNITTFFTPRNEQNSPERHSSIDTNGKL